MTYNSYILDKEHNRFIGDFEGAYKNCESVYKEQFDCSRLKFDVVRSWIQDMPQAQVLDIGAGYGCFVNELHKNGTEVLGVEISPSAIEKGKKMYGKNLPLQVADISQTLNFQQKFDVIICFGVLGFLLDKIDICLKNIDQCLAANGKVAFSIGFSQEHKIFRDVLQNEVSFANVIEKYFHVNNFIVDYLNPEADNSYSEKQAKDLIIFAKKRNDVR